MVTRGNTRFSKLLIVPPMFSRSGFEYRQTNKQIIMTSLKDLYLQGDYKQPFVCFQLFSLVHVPRASSLQPKELGSQVSRRLVIISVFPLTSHFSSTTLPFSFFSLNAYCQNKENKSLRGLNITYIYMQKIVG